MPTSKASIPWDIMLALDRMYDKELWSKYPDTQKDPFNTYIAMLKERNIPLDAVRFTTKKSPYLNKETRDILERTAQTAPYYAVMLSRDTHDAQGSYPLPIAHPYEIYMPVDKELQTPLTTIRHEIEHVSDFLHKKPYSIPFSPNSDIDTDSAHFTSDYKDRMFPWEGREAIGLMLERLNEPTPQTGEDKSSNWVKLIKKGAVK